MTTQKEKDALLAADIEKLRAGLDVAANYVMPALAMMTEHLAIVPSDGGDPPPPPITGQPTKVVDPVNGDDANDGRPGSPWKTLTKAGFDAVPGDFVGIMGGTYTEGLRINVSGAVGKQIVFGKHPSAVSDVRLEGEGVRCIGRSHIEIRSLTIRNCLDQSWGIGIYIEGSSVGTATDIVVRDNVIDHCLSSGIACWGVPWGRDAGNYERLNAVSIEDNTLSRCCHGGYNECITLANGVNDFYIVSNIVKDGLDGTNGGEGIDVKEGCAGGIISDNQVYNLARRAIYIDGGKASVSTNDITIKRNYIHDCPEGFAIMSEGGAEVRGIRFVNNLIFDVKLGAFLFDHPAGGNAYVLADIAFVNNTIWKNAQDGLDLNAKRAANVLVQNNILSSYTDRHGKANEWTNWIGGNPGFVSDTDYHLSASSPCKDMGTNNGAPDDDLEFNGRPVNGTVDIGCYEKQ